MKNNLFWAFFAIALVVGLAVGFSANNLMVGKGIAASETKTATFNYLSDKWSAQPGASSRYWIYNSKFGYRPIEITSDFSYYALQWLTSPEVGGGGQYLYNYDTKKYASITLEGFDVFHYYSAGW